MKKDLIIIAEERGNLLADLILSAKNIRKNFDNDEVLRGISLDVHRGDVIAIIGPSGSGKSTFLRCLNKLENIDGGSIKINDEYMVEDATEGNKVQYAPDGKLRELRRKLGMVFQSFNLFPHMSVLSNITEAPKRVLKLSAQEADAEAMNLLKLVGLENKAKSFPCELSGGQQQRIAIARALAMKPELICFDEPTSALDPELTGEVLAVMRNLALAGSTMLVVTHEMSFARNVANKVVFMDAGLIVEEGDPVEFFKNPKHPRSVAFCATI